MSTDQSIARWVKIDRDGICDECAEFRHLIASYPGPDSEPWLCADCANGDPGRLLSMLSRWIDDSNAHRDPEAVLWGRVAKITEEAGEAIEALIGMTGQNPRKGFTHDADDLVAELLDVAVTALGAVEHVTGNTGASLDLLQDKISSLAARAGLID